MPPIDPAALRARTSALAAKLEAPPAAAAAVRSLLVDYADRTHRASPRVASSQVENALKTAPPVLRAIIAALREPARANPANALALADALWAGGSREERRLAAELLGLAADRAPAEALALVDRWAVQIESNDTADALAELGLGGLARADPAAHLAYAQRWNRHPNRWARRFAVALLWPLVKDKHWDNVPGALAIIGPVMKEADGDVRRAVADVLAQLAPKSPAEISRFLLDQAVLANLNAQWIIRNAMTTLGPEQQAAIVRALRS
jgi:3-methyladenine DNA glycosylase AlkD